MLEQPKVIDPKPKGKKEELVLKTRSSEPAKLGRKQKQYKWNQKSLPAPNEAVSPYV